MKVFLFDTNKCVGCHACVVACGLENNVPPEKEAWRMVLEGNKGLWPRYDQYHLSLACNHCEEPACLNACPAGAYSMDDDTGAVVLNHDRCIGCRYCTWACPYDAPKYDPSSGTIDKCTFCISRINNSGKPACAVNCPTAALEYGIVDEEDGNTTAGGFPLSDLKPRIRFRNSRKKQPLKIEPAPVIPDGAGQFPERFKSPDPKIHFGDEWSLWAFTLLAPILTGLYAGVISGYLIIHPSLYTTLVLVSLMLSVMHLGRKLRILHAFRNIESSWLSREIFLFTLFGVLSVAYLFFFTASLVLGMAGLLVGLAFLFATDRVYKFFENGTDHNSSSVLLTGLLWISVVVQEPLPVLFIMAVKFILYVWRKTGRLNTGDVLSIMVSTLRVFLLAVVPVLMYLFLEIPFVYIFIPLFAGEVIDRYEFYTEHYIQSPSRQVFIEKHKHMNKNEFH